MQFLTWGDIKSEVQKDHNIEGDPEYDEAELVNMCNRAINRVEARILGLQQDYFLTKLDPNITLVSGTSEYSLPSDIYANKIRRVFLKDTTGYTRRMYRATNIDDMEETSYYSSTNLKKNFRYMVLNSSSGGIKLTLNTDTQEGEIVMYYTRNAARFTAVGGDSQVCDIPEYVDAVIAYMKYLVEYKDKSPTLAVTKQDYIDIMNELTNSLAQAVNDEDMTIEPDTEIFDDHI